MILIFHRPEGIYTINSETVTDAQLAQLGFTREKFDEYVASQRDLPKEMKDLKARVKELERKWLS